MKLMNNSKMMANSGAIVQFNDSNEDSGGSSNSDSIDEVANEETDEGHEDASEQGAGSKRAVLADLSRERDRRQKAEAEKNELAERLKEIEDAKKTDLQKAVERAETAEAKLAEFERSQKLSNLRTKVAKEKHVPREWVDFLHGETEEEMNAAADRILANLGTGGGGQWPTLHAPRDRSHGSMEAGREAAKNFRP